jgi:hypothetical protein
MEDDFWESSENEIRILYEHYNEFLWISDFRAYNLYSRYEEEEATLIIVNWDDGVMEGINFVKISQYQGALLITELRFQCVENREDFLAAYGFMDAFGLLIRLNFTF